MDYLIMSAVVRDTIYYCGQQTGIDAVGGAGIYALAGAKIWDDSVSLVTGIGEDFFSQFGGWFTQNSISMQSMIVKDRNTPHTIIRYFEDGERTEIPEFGSDHFHALEATPKDLEKNLSDTKGVYIFKNSNNTFWEEIFEIKNENRFRLLWEIAADAACKNNLHEVLAIARKVDMLSVNLSESCAMFGVDSLGKVCEQYQASGIPLVYLRNGADGTYLIDSNRIVHVPSVKDAEVVDTTGGGNSSTGGALIGLCRDCSLEEIGAMGNVSASYIIRQNGVPLVINNTLRNDAREKKKRIIAEL